MFFLLGLQWTISFWCQTALYCTVVWLCWDAEDDLFSWCSSTLVLITCKWVGLAGYKTGNRKGLMAVGSITSRRQIKENTELPECPAHLLIKVCNHTAIPDLKGLNLRLNSRKCQKWKCHVLSTTCFKSLMLHLIAEVITDTFTIKGLY